jgi:hypothetical protein
MSEPNVPTDRRGGSDRRSRPGAAPKPPRFSLLPLLLLFLGLVLLNHFLAPDRGETVAYSELKNRVAAGQVAEVRIGERAIEAVPTDSIREAGVRSGGGRCGWRTSSFCPSWRPGR